MIIYLYGPDSYRRQKKINEYIERYKTKYTGIASNFYLDKNEDWDKFKDFCKTQSLFEVSKLGLVYNFSELDKKDIKVFKILIKDNLKNKDLTLILNQEKKPTKEFSFLLKEPVVFHSFDFLKGDALKKFLDIEIDKRKIKMDNESKELILLASSQNIWGLIMELDKLALLNKAEINKKTLEEYVDLSLGVDVFSCLSQIKGSRSVGDKLFLIEKLFSNCADPVMIFNLFSASPYLNKSQKIKMADYDVAIKSGKLEYKEVLLNIMLDTD
jgi:DNA polymerase III delta subunit